MKRRDGRTGATDMTDPAAVLHRVEAPDVPQGDRRYRPISDYAMVGNAQSAALIASDGAIDWLCLPHFDSPAVLCRLLDADRGGYLTIQPDTAVRGQRRRYRERSNVLETRFEIDGGELILTDAMPLPADERAALLDGVWSGIGRHRLVRLMTARDRDIDLTLDARIGFDFAATTPRVELVAGKGAIATDGKDSWLALAWPGKLTHGGDGGFRGRLTLRAGETAACMLGHEHDEQAARSLLEQGGWADEVRHTDDGWRDWTEELDVRGPYAGAMMRSALTLRMLTFEPTGAVIAAPTTSLPEEIGGVRNWDYRYCWLRDATMTLYALLLVGDKTAAQAFWGWIERTCAGQPAAHLQIMYGIHGERDLPERTLPHLAGYRDSSPVRVGNAAHEQRQLDIFGELIDALWFYDEHGGFAGDRRPIAPTVWSLFRDIADLLCDIWRKPDHGIWEIRGEKRHYVYSKLMCWVGLDRAVRLAIKHDALGDIDRWARERDTIHAEIIAKGYNRERGAFTIAYGSNDLDAANLRMLLVGFLPCDDPRIRGTIERIQDELQVDGLVRRYLADDGLPGDEGAFSICTFWLIDCLTALGRIEEARQLFEQMLGFSSDLGLFAEEVDPATGAALGNYPQAFTHLALIDAAVDLTEALARDAPVPGEHVERAEQVRRGRSERGEPGGDGPRTTTR